ncbi:MAG: 60S ribosomal export protein NMD3 [Candidatus Jordarchaeum sp.]|uniref:60S ribosomal export protein NMD3 n=1 Tax=Candidatus Jordarchaeum sp. TaxID=2823881 RepID=UPI00404A70AA
MAKRFCALCGKTETKLIENLCSSCYFKKHSPFTIKNEPKIRICPNCYSYKLSKKWMQSESSNNVEFLEQAIEQALPHFIKHSPDFEISIQPQIQEEIEIKNRIEIPVLITAKKEDILISETVPITINLESSPCGICTRKKTGYYEAILQFRSLRGRISEEERQQIYNIIETILNQEKFKEDYIPQVKEKKQGLDAYVSTVGLARNIAESIKEIMGANLQESFKLSGMKDGKKKGKISISVRLPSFSVGEIVQLPEKTLIIEKIEKGNLIGKNLETGERLTVQHKELWESEIRGWKPETKEYLIISITKDSLQLMNLKTYEIHEIKKEAAPPNLKEGDTVRATKIDEKILILTPEPT